MMELTVWDVEMWSASIVIDGDGQNMAFNLGLLGKKKLVDFLWCESCCLLPSQVCEECIGKKECSELM